MGKVSRGKTSGEKGNCRKAKQRIDRQLKEYSWFHTIWGDCQLAYWKETVFYPMYDKCRFVGAFFVRNLDASMERSARTVFSWQNGAISLIFGPVFFFIFAQWLLSNLYYLYLRFLSMRKRLSFSRELLWSSVR